MSDINRVSTVDVAATQRTAATDHAQEVAPQSTPQPTYQTATNPAADELSLPSAAPPLAPPAGTSDIQQATVALSTMSENVAFDFAEIAAMLTKLNHEVERASRDQVINDILSVADSAKQSAQDIRAGAGLALASGIVSGAGQIVSGGINVAGGIKSFKIASEAGPAAKDAALTKNPTTESAAVANESLAELSKAEEPAQTQTAQQEAAETTAEITEDLTANKATTKAQLDKVSVANLKEQSVSFILQQKAQAIGMRTQGLASITSGSFQTASAGLKYGSEEFQAQSKEQDAHTETLRAGLERERQYADSVHKSSQDLLQSLKDLIQSEHQTSSQIASSRV